MAGDNSRIYNAISIVFAVLTVAMLVFVIVKMLGPEEGADVVVVQPTQFVPPTPTATNTPTATWTPSITPIPTWTPSPTDTLTATFTPTLTRTVAPSATITDTPGATLTPSDTPTPSISPTFTPTPTPTGPTPTLTPTDSPYFFTLREDIIFNPNTMNSAGCAWQGIGGSVLGLDGQEVTAEYQIRVYGAGFDGVARTGSNSLYGPNSGWEIPIDTNVSPRSYLIQVESLFNVPLSQAFSVSFPGDCNTNMAIARFIQTSEIGGP